MSISAQSVPIEVTLRGNLGEGAGTYARTKVAGALRVARQPVLRAHVVLDYRHDPALVRRAVASVSVDVNGRLLRARSSAATMQEAVDDLEYRLRRQLVQLHDRTRTRSSRTGRPFAT